MNLGVRLAISLVLPLVALTAAFGYVNQQRSQALLREELHKEARAIALVVQTAAQDYLRDRQLANLRHLVDQVSGYERVLGLRIFDAHGGLTYQSSTLAEYPFQHHATLARVLREHRPAQTYRRVGSESAVGFIYPLDDEQGHVAGAVQVLQLESFIREDSRANLLFILALTGAMVVATVTIILLATRMSVARPIQDLVSSFREVGAGEMSARVQVRGQDEFGRLALEFNRMCERLESAHRSLVSEQEMRQQIEGRLRNAERLAGLGRLAAGLAHEIGTPLNVISGRTSGLLRHLSGNERAAASLQIIHAQIDRIVRIVRDMLDFARMKTPRRAPTDVGGVVRSVLDLAESRIEQGGGIVRLSIPETLPAITADVDQLQQVFLNLVLNAIDAMTEGGTLSIHAEERMLRNPERGGPARRHVAITFEDTGSGISPEDRDHVFDPFFTTKDPGRGTGLGLSVSYGIIEEHGGWFDLESHPGRGTRVTVHLPVEALPALPEVA